MPNMIGRAGCRTMEMDGGSSASHLARAPCVPLFCVLFNTGGNRRASGLPREGGDHFYCAVEPSPVTFGVELKIRVVQASHRGPTMMPLKTKSAGGTHCGRKRKLWLAPNLGENSKRVTNPDGPIHANRFADSRERSP